MSLLVEDLLTRSLNLSSDNENCALKTAWCFWQFKNEKIKSKSEWKDNIKLIASVTTLGEFKRQLNELNMQNGYDYMFFRSGVPPMWEHEENISGGRWVLNYPKNEHQTNNIQTCFLLNHWKKCLFLLVNEQFGLELNSHINGVWLNNKNKSEKLSLWTKNAEESDIQHRIGRALKEFLCIRFMVFVYEPHQNSIEFNNQLKEAREAAKQVKTKSLPTSSVILK